MSGYTAMSEAFAARGAAGAEELGRLLNEHFDGAVDLVERFGGSVGKFGGDALSAVFAVDEGPDAPGRAVRCAIEIQEGMKRFRSTGTSVGTFDLSCKIGLAIGDVLTATVSAPGGRLEWILAGSAVDGIRRSRTPRAERRSRVRRCLSVALPRAADPTGATRVLGHRGTRTGPRAAPLPPASAPLGRRDRHPGAVRAPLGRGAGADGPSRLRGRTSPDRGAVRGLRCVEHRVR